MFFFSSAFAPLKDQPTPPETAAPMQLKYEI
jgi:hypothetical protein